MNTAFNCVIDLGVLGNLHCLNKLIHHTSTKQKKEIIFNKKTSIKALLLKNFDESLIPKKNLNYGKSMKFNSSSNNFQVNKETMNKNMNFAMTSKNFPNMGSSHKEIFNNLNNSNLNSSGTHLDQTQREIKHGDSIVLEKLKHNIKLMNTTTKFRNEALNKNSFDYGDSVHNNLNNFQNIPQNNNFSKTTGNNFYPNQTHKTKISISAANNTYYNNQNNQNNNNNNNAVVSSNNFYNPNINNQNNNNTNFNNTATSNFMINNNNLNG